MKYFITFTLIIFFCSDFLFSQDKEDWKLNGQIQLRSELDGRDFSNKTYPLFYSSLRTRFSVEKTILNKASLFVQIQDSRILGEEKNTQANIKNLDIYQAYIKLDNPFEIPLTLQAGRFAMTYGTERFIGSVGWHYIGRSFDGLKISFDMGARTDLFALSIRDSVPYIAYAASSVYGHPFKYDSSYSLYGFWSTYSWSKKHRVDIFGYYEIDRKLTNLKDKELAQATFGFNHIGTYKKFSTITEAAFQTGKRSIKNVSAYLVSLSGSYLIDEVKLGLGFDLLSGNDPTNIDKSNCFAPSFGTNHKFYGYMDYFILIPSNTFNLGLNDFYLSFDWMPKESKFNFNFYIHHFASDKKSNSGDKIFGQEFDFTARYNFIKGTAVTFGTSVFLPNELMKKNFSTVNGERKDAAFWSYLMITANF